MKAPGYRHGQPGASSAVQYFGAAPPAALHDALPPPAALQDDLPLLAGAAPPLALHEAFPPEADGSDAGGVLPPQATVDPISIPATADTARVFARFISGLLALLDEERIGCSRRVRAGIR